MKEYELERFVEAQNESYYGYNTALDEMKAGRKRSHWIWYIFPQLVDLGRSHTAKLYGIIDIDEARAYLAHPVLGARLREISEVILRHKNSDPEYLMGGFPDNLKLQSCMTLFALCSEKGSVFHKVLDKYFGGEMDSNTVKLAG